LRHKDPIRAVRKYMIINYHLSKAFSILFSNSAGEEFVIVMCCVLPLPVLELAVFVSINPSNSNAFKYFQNVVWPLAFSPYSSQTKTYNFFASPLEISSLFFYIFRAILIFDVQTIYRPDSALQLLLYIDLVLCLQLKLHLCLFSLLF
jgi:hypothetical protein